MYPYTYAFRVENSLKHIKHRKSYNYVLKIISSSDSKPFYERVAKIDLKGLYIKCKFTHIELINFK